MTNQKGGVGKTANTINLGAALAESGRRVLLVDFDPQGHLSDALGTGESPDDRTLRGYLLGEWSGDPRQIVVTHRDRLDVLPTNVDMSLLERGLYMQNNRERRLARLLDRFEDDYDTCVIDCAPSLGVITDCALMAARRRPGRRGGVIVPVEAEDSSIRALRLLLRQIGLLSAEMDIDLDVLGLVPSRIDMRDGDIVTSTLEAFRGLGEPPVIAEIKKRAEVRKAWRSKVSVLEYAPKADVSNWYRDLAKKVYA
ncbi:ParA family protein [Streptomyces sp. NPDC059255]|uniref:ParA family protein n=1 Tax=Streptomyces sp. NPDC059255 TaxID=3346793 RepID=UPI00367F4CC5